MRSLRFVLLLASAATIVACSDDSSDPAVDAGPDGGADVGVDTAQDTSGGDTAPTAIEPSDFAFDAPTNGDSVAQGTVDVSVSWDAGELNGIRATVNGATAESLMPPFDGHEATFTANLSEGVNTIEVTLVRADDSTISRELVVIREVEVAPTPSMRIDAPDDGATIDGDTATIELSWENGTPTEVSYAIDGGDAQVLDEALDGGSVSFDIDVPVGVSTVAVTVAFDDGSSITRSVVLVRDLPDGAVVIMSPREPTTDGAIAHVAGVVIGLEPTGVTVAHAGGEVDALVQVAGDSWEFYAPTPLVLGENTLEVTASFDEVDDAHATVTVTRSADETDPVIEWIVPTDGHDVRAARAFVEVGVSDNVEVASASAALNGGEAVELALSDDVASGHFMLAAGANTLALTVTDAAGNTTETTHPLYLGHRVSSGGAHGGAIVDGELFTWGRNNKGQVGVGYTSTLSGATEEEPHPSAPVSPRDDVSFVSIAFSQNTSIALDDAGNVWAWGDNDSGQLGVGTAATDDPFDEDDRLVPTQIASLTDVVAISRGFDHTLALDSTGQVWAWGDNGDGQLGEASLEDSDVPVAVTAIDDAVAILGASATSYAIREDGTVWAWGENTYGNLGLGTEDDEAHATPTQVPDLADAVDFAAGRDHILVLTEAGTLYLWGLNGSGQVHPDEEDRGSPLLRDDGIDVVAVYAGGNQSFVEDVDGRVYGWGQSINGNLGRLDEEDTTLPSDPVFGVSDSISVGIGALQGLVMRRDGRIFSWGWSFEGSLGGGDTIINRWAYRVPILVDAQGE